MSEQIRNNQEQIKDPPKDLDAERNLLGALINDGTLLTRINNELGNLNEEDFASEKNRIIYHEILKRATSSDDFNITVMADILENQGLLEKAGGRPYLLGLASITSPTSAIVEYALIIRNKARRRRLIGVSEHITQIAYNPEGRTVDEIFDEAQGLIFKLSEDNAHTDSGPRSAIDVAAELLDKIREDSLNGNRMTGTATGFSELDELTSGLQPGSLNIVAARPGVGKTSFAMNVVENIAMNPETIYPALVFSLEMPAHQIVLRMLSSFGKVSMKDLTEGRAQSGQWHDIVRKISLLARTVNDEKQSKLYIDDSGDITPLELRTRARKLAMEHGGLSVIMVDYIQLMKGQTRSENRSLEVGEISRSLKLLAKDLNVPIIALSQLNREVEGRKDHRPMNSDLRESGSLEQDADMIMFLHREAVYKHGDEAASDDGKALLIVSKNRNGAIKDIELQFKGEYTSFFDKASFHAQEVVPMPETIYQ